MKNKIKFYKALSKKFKRFQLMEIAGCEPNLTAKEINYILSEIYD
jgi:hypothetical protein